MTLNMLRSVVSSVALRAFLAAMLLLLALLMARPGWCHYDRGCPPELFLTRIDTTLVVMFGAVLLFLAAKQVLQGLFEQRPLAHEGASTAPFDLKADDGAFLIVELHDNFEPVTGPAGWTHADA